MFAFRMWFYAIIGEGVEGVITWTWVSLDEVQQKSDHYAYHSIQEFRVTVVSSQATGGYPDML